MKLEDQVCSLELAKRLKELGVKQESIFSYDATMSPDGRTEVLSIGCPIFGYSAFTVAELGEMFPYVSCLTYSSNMHTEWWCNYAEEDREGVLHLKHTEKSATEADARAKMLVYLIDKGIVKP